MVIFWLYLSHFIALFCDAVLQMFRSCVVYRLYTIPQLSVAYPSTSELPECFFEAWGVLYNLQVVAQFSTAKTDIFWSTN